MIAGFGKRTLVIGSGAEADIRLQGPGVAPEHARLVHEGGGRVLFVDAGAGQTLAGGQPLSPGASVAFDFRTPFAVGGVSVPLAHRAIALMLCERGQAAPEPGRLLLGRDGTRVHVVVHHPNVSGVHAALTGPPLAVTDQNSTSGTWLGQSRLPPGQTTQVPAGTVIALGPVPLDPALAAELLQASAEGPPRAPRRGPSARATAP